MRKLFTLTTALTIASCAPAFADAPACGSFEQVAQLLKDQYQEEPASAGIMNNGKLFTIFATADGKTWTGVQTTPDGVSCVVGSGRSWFTASPSSDPQA